MVNNTDIVVIGSGIGSLSVACLLANAGKKVTVIEQNYLPGGCTSSYWRKGFVFEAGATTFVGLDTHQPLAYLQQKLGISWPAVPLELPMQVRLSDGSIINRYQSLDTWIQEAKAEFGYQNQEAFWKLCFKISRFVWDVSVKQTRFPPSNSSDVWFCIKNATIRQAWYARWSFFSMSDVLKMFGLHTNARFVDFVNAQLMITAQNTAEHVNALFGATALCYTNYANYYIKGGMMGAVQPFIDFLDSQKGILKLREKVVKIEKNGNNYAISTDKSAYVCQAIFSGIPINNVVEIAQFPLKISSKKVMKSVQLNSAFQMGIAFKTAKHFSTLHYQIHLKTPLHYINATTIFVSLSHESDIERSDVSGIRVASVSTHWPNPELELHDFNKEPLESQVIEVLVLHRFFEVQDVVYTHSSTPDSWKKWTGRKWGFVGGYPQFMHIKPWQMPDARLDGHAAYQVGDSVYPGQGIPGVALSGIIAYHKYMDDQGLTP